MCTALPFETGTDFVTPYVWGCCLVPLGFGLPWPSHVGWSAFHKSFEVVTWVPVIVLVSVGYCSLTTGDGFECLWSEVTAVKVGVVDWTAPEGCKL